MLKPWMRKREPWKKIELCKIVEIRTGKKTIGCKRIFNIQYKANGTLESYKARLVAKGYTQTYGIDSQETFAPIAKMNAIRILLSLATNFDLPLQQFSVKINFLHTDQEVEVYMDILPRYEKESWKNKVKNSLYGLKQLPQTWFGKLMKAMVQRDYHQSQGDHTLFITL